MKMPVFFHKDQLIHQPRFEWSFGEKINHPETTHRAQSIANAIKNCPKYFVVKSPKRIPLKAIKEIHDPCLIDLYKSAMNLPINETFYPNVYVHSNVKANPKDIKHAGYYCFDSGTPLNATTYFAAAWSAACALEAAKVLTTHKKQVSYALCRPPGHHANQRMFGGYCYLNNAAIAANYLSRKGKVAILDIDFHHGNGTQDIFYERNDVLTISIHGDPKIFYPYFFGHSTEKGEKEGVGYNINYTLPSGIEFDTYEKYLIKALSDIKKFAPTFLVVSAGFDTYLGDPVGRFNLQTPDYFNMGRLIASLHLPTVIIQEGGYVAEMLGENVVSLLKGFDTNFSI